MWKRSEANHWMTLHNSFNLPFCSFHSDVTRAQKEVRFFPRFAYVLLSISMDTIWLEKEPVHIRDRYIRNGNSIPSKARISCFLCRLTPLSYPFYTYTLPMEYVRAMEAIERKKKKTPQNIITFRTMIPNVWQIINIYVTHDNIIIRLHLCFYSLYILTVFVPTHEAMFCINATNRKHLLATGFCWYAMNTKRFSCTANTRTPTEIFNSATKIQRGVFF